MPKKPKRPLDLQARRAQEAARKRRWRAHRRAQAQRPTNRSLADLLDDPAASGRESVSLVTRLSLSTRQRLDNASFAHREPLRAIVERGLELELDRLERQHNRGLPFNDPPPGHGARARSERARQARQGRAAST